ncbi:MAG TPA: HD domain-containing protein [Candidatus Nitrosotenuis sp.]|nr:HD domain-containing protein [Candidatus Nitrosotenuis sp.]
MTQSLKDPELLRRRLLQQDLRLLRTAEDLARTIRAEPRFCQSEPRAYLVGGFVRDAVLGLRSKDADLEVFGLPPERLETLLKHRYPGKVVGVGKAFGILKLHLAHDVELDVSVPRRESKRGPGHTGFLVEGDPDMSLEEAARRRDFTINAMAVDPLDYHFFDPFGGLDDLQARVLRVVDRERFGDDPLRVYRGVGFAARFGLQVEPATFELMAEMVARGDLAELSRERVTTEIKKLLLKSERPSVGFELMVRLGIIARHYPELEALRHTPQDPEWHPEGDVWTHTMLVLDQAALIVRRPEWGFDEEEKLQVLLGSLCHDLGKPATTRLRRHKGVERLRALGHPEAGRGPAQSLLSRWTFGLAVERGALVLTTQHLAPGQLYGQLQRGEMNQEQYANAVRKLLKRIHPVSWRVLLAGCEADFRGRGLPGQEKAVFAAGEMLARTVRARGLEDEAVRPLLLGRDLLARGVTPGPQVGDYIRRIEEARDRGEIRTREEALQLLERLLRP